MFHISENTASRSPLILQHETSIRNRSPLQAPTFQGDRASRQASLFVMQSYSRTLEAPKTSPIIISSNLSKFGIVPIYCGFRQQYPVSSHKDNIQGSCLSQQQALRINLRSSTIMSGKCLHGIARSYQIAEGSATLQHFLTIHTDILQHHKKLEIHHPLWEFCQVPLDSS